MKRSLYLSILLSLVLCCLLSVSAFAFQPDEIVGTNRDLLVGNGDPGSMISGTPLGYALADAVRAAGGTELAIAVGGDITGNLIGGDISWGELNDVVRGDQPLSTAQLTARQLTQLLELGCANITIDEADCIDTAASRSPAFAQPSGFSYEVDGSAPAGERIRRIRLENGDSLDPQDESRIFTITAPSDLLSGAYGSDPLPARELNITLAEAAAAQLADGSFGIAGGIRINFIGTADVKILDYFPVGAIVLVAILIGLFRYKNTAKTDFTLENKENEKGYERRSVRDFYKL